MYVYILLAFMQNYQPMIIARASGLKYLASISPNVCSIYDVCGCCHFFWRATLEIGTLNYSPLFCHDIFWFVIVIFFSAHVFTSNQSAFWIMYFSDDSVLYSEQSIYLYHCFV